MLTSLARIRSDDAATFYESRQGQRTALLLNERLRRIMPPMRGRRILGIGYTAPYLPESAEFAVSARLLHAQTQKTLHPSSKDCIVDSARLPFDDLSMDAVLVVHGLEFTRVAPDFLRAIWRTLTDDGVLILIVPNRSGYWAHTDATPFGHGSPYSSRQLTRLLDQTLFRIDHHSGALMAPPAALSATQGRLMEQIGHRLRLPCGGVHLVTARKNAYAGIPMIDDKLAATLPQQVARPA
ncbi:class I SAM-dependent methyltransferase [Gluconobacter kondonii]|uniref:Methyltransferase type 11 n=1 Tax=Gluconobacter kondonii TaxID=941463 RepID=A0ABQ5WRK8_9PROT|nr:methyltransferase domain-containing protein [Gluconobacter kondonii]MCP1235661.1 class I SAM-dependent methyltransferase [Gluconobacter kondonii]GBR31215.1 SAM-dependent methyltransferase [Gluconobacter kondonii NBRC 3266]GLQ66162.1 methyltransferase type 11 [Gluconobacter kondonii]